MARRFALWIWSAPLLLASLGAYAANTLGDADAVHLLVRTGFGARSEDVSALRGLTREQAVASLLKPNRGTPASPAPQFRYERPGRFKDLSAEEKKAVQQEWAAQGLAVRAWWASEMLHAATPADALSERMVLFWHNHFVSSQQKVKSAALMLQQNQLLRRHALGYFGTLLHEVAKDPAMVIYLDLATNREESPNENFAREVMELFTLGEGHYSEKDIKEAARAFTGWSFAPATGEFRWRPMIHDGGEKTVLGRRGNFDGDAVLDILLDQPACARWIVSKMWREFVSPNPDAVEVERIARAFQKSNYDIRFALRQLLLTPAFWAEENRGSLVKSPVDLVVGTVRTLDVRTADPMPFALLLRHLGQDLFAPPNVKGWPGGDTWLNSSTLLARKQFLEQLLRIPDGPPPARMMQASEARQPAPVDYRRRFVEALGSMRFDHSAWISVHPDRGAMTTALLAVPPTQSVAAPSPMQELRAILLDPAYQVK